VARRTTLETVGETTEVSDVSFEDIGETCTDDDIIEDPIDAYTSDEEEEEEEQEEGQVEEAIFEKELTRFAIELNIPIRPEQSAEDLEHLASYFTFLAFARVINSSPCCSAALHLHSTLALLREMAATKKDSIGSFKEVLKDSKKKAPEILIEAFTAMKVRNVTEALNLLDEAKRRLEKDMKVADLSFRERVLGSRLLLFVECLLKCYSAEKQIFLPIYLMPEAARERMERKVKKLLTRLMESMGRKKTDSKWLKFGTVERSKDSRESDQGLLDSLLRVTCRHRSSPP
jgi:hypothetical protein